MSDKRRGLGRGLGALIPTAPTAPRGDRPVDVFFPGREEPGARPAAVRDVVPETAWAPPSRSVHDDAGRAQDPDPSAPGDVSRETLAEEGYHRVREIQAEFARVRTALRELA